MYSDHRPCAVCGAEVRPTAREVPSGCPPPEGPVGPSDGVVGGGDEGPDVRVCSNPDCPTQDPDSAERP